MDDHHQRLRSVLKNVCVCIKNVLLFFSYLQCHHLIKYKENNRGQYFLFLCGEIVQQLPTGCLAGARQPIVSITAELQCSGEPGVFQRHVLFHWLHFNFKRGFYALLIADERDGRVHRFQAQKL